MLRRCATRLSGDHGHGLPLEQAYVYGVPKRTFPYYEHPISSFTMPVPMGLYVTKNFINVPLVTGLTPNYGWQYYTCFVLSLIAIDLLVGMPQPFLKDRVPGRPLHNFFNNNNGSPHHWWQYQDGWSMPNPSGVFRWTE